MPRYLATIRRDPQAGEFVIGAPDFPEIDERCERLSDVDVLARAAIHAALGRCRREGADPPPPTPKKRLEARPEYRNCFLLTIDWEAPRS
ncbi:MAG TPA: hypothetical protein VKB65_00835 [Myxococcota bacterium]|nr:hypothetical protein [Myxococcota bacterium]